MKTKWPWILILLVLVLAGNAVPVHADGIIIPPVCPKPGCPPPPCPGFECPPFPRPMEQLDIRYHHVTVTIEDQLAVTHVDQVFYNPNDWAVEGTYVFPLPLDAVVTNFTLWVDGKPVQGEVLSADQARQYYEETVRNLRDPALLEYQGRGAVKASIFPIQPRGERRIELEYSQALTAQNGLVRYVYPLNTEKFSRLPLEDVSIRVEIRGTQSIRAVYSPTHPVSLDRQDDHHVIAGYEAKDVRPDSDFNLFYSLGESEAFHLFTYRDPADPADPDGFFLMLLAPKPDQGNVNKPIAKDVLLVLDHSGSMEGGGKFQQAQAALRYILKHLNPEDRFYVEAFSTGSETYASGLRPAEEANEAIAWVDGLNARGSTDINRALTEAASVAGNERPTYLIFLTDGLPTEGVTDRQQIVDNFARSASPNLRLFIFGVGNDVDTFLLDTLSQEHHGQSTYVRPGDPLDEVLSTFYERISIPVLTDLKLDFGSLAAYDIYPDPLPDLFAGSQVIVVGRYREGGAADITLKGEVNGQVQEFRYPEQLFVKDSRGVSASLETLPRLWATRKIGYLLNRIRLQGPDKETIQQVVSLSVRYGIVTPYTSYLVTEPMALGAEAQSKIAEQAYGQAQAAPLDATGKNAVDRAAQEGQLQSAQVAPQAPAAGSAGGGNTSSDGGSGTPGAQIRVVGARTFIFQSGMWTDTLFDPQSMRVQKVVFLSDAYFQLVRARPDLSAAFALGDQVIVVVDGQVYQVVREGNTTDPVEMPTTLPTLTVIPSQPTPVPAQPSPPALNSPRVPAATEPAAPRPSTCLPGLAPLGLLLAIAWLLKMRG